MAAPSSSHISMLSKPVRRLLEENKPLSFDPAKNKIWCTLSGHEMPATEDAILSYIQGKKYKKLFKNSEYDHTEILQHIEGSKKRGLQHLLFCKLTLRHINDCPEDVERHIKGRKFQRALARWKKCQETGETFKPLTSFRQKAPPGARDRSQKKATKGDNAESDAEQDVEEDSDLSDLYPEADFAESSEDESLENEELEGEDDEYEFEAMETELEPLTPKGDSSIQNKTETPTLKNQDENIFSSSRKRSSATKLELQTNKGPPIPKKKKKLKH